MPRRTYEIYVTTYTQTVDALRSTDERVLRSICAGVARRSGIESTVALMAVSDAECGRPPRSRSTIKGLFQQDLSHLGASIKTGATSTEKPKSK